MAKGSSSLCYLPLFPLSLGKPPCPSLCFWFSEIGTFSSNSSCNLSSDCFCTWKPGTVLKCKREMNFLISYWTMNCFSLCPGLTGSPLWRFCSTYFDFCDSKQNWKPLWDLMVLVLSYKRLRSYSCWLFWQYKGAFLKSNATEHL